MLVPILLLAWFNYIFFPISSIFVAKMSCFWHWVNKKIFLHLPFIKYHFFVMFQSINNSATETLHFRLSLGRLSILHVKGMWSFTLASTPLWNSNWHSEGAYLRGFKLVHQQGELVWAMLLCLIRINGSSLC